MKSHAKKGSSATAYTKRKMNSALNVKQMDTKREKADSSEVKYNLF
jgi:hypothetical protein